MNFSPSFCQIDLAAIAANFRSLGDAEKLMPVIKADAYGHGLLAVAKKLAQSGAKRFALGFANEGVLLREHGHDEQLLLLQGCQTTDEWGQAVEYGLMPIVGSPEDIKAAQNACGPNRRMNVAIKHDSGMGRLGFKPGDDWEIIELLRTAPSLQPVLAVSHLACADMPEESDYTRQQIADFESFYEAMRSAFPAIEHSLGNSAATLEKMPGDISRPGLAIYGGDPFGPESKYHLNWAMSVAAPIIHVHNLSAGQSVSYGKIFTADKPIKVAVVACGYATGLARALSNRATMLVHGKRVRQIGRVCMGMTMLEVTDIPHVRPGDLAWILGGEAVAGEESVTAWEMAQALNTIPYEILCQMGSMNDRVYINA